MVTNLPLVQTSSPWLILILVTLLAGALGAWLATRLETSLGVRHSGDDSRPASHDTLRPAA